MRPEDELARCAILVAKTSLLPGSVWAVTSCLAAFVSFPLVGRTKSIRFASRKDDGSGVFALLASVGIRRMLSRTAGRHCIFQLSYVQDHHTLLFSAKLSIRDWDARKPNS